MKDIALQIITDKADNKLNVLREYLQNYLLFLMQRIGIASGIYFLGGTALRFLYRIRRYSEDLDFSAGETWVPYHFESYMEKIERGLEKAGYSCMVKIKDNQVVQKAIIGFNNLLSEAGLVQKRKQKLSIHIEIDLKPPPGWNSKKTVVDLYMPVLLQHYDLPSMFAGKLHAVLTREYSKGRDIFDLFWYRSRWGNILPNFILLNHALSQTEKNFVTLTESNWLEILSKKINSLNWKQVMNDVNPFLEFKDDSLTFTKDNLLTLIEPK